MPPDYDRAHSVFLDVFRDGAFWDMRGAAYVHEPDAPLSDQTANKPGCRSERNSGFIAGEQRFT
jgi:hypothetical protein